MDHNDSRLQKVTSSGGRAARDHLIAAALAAGWDVQLRGATDTTPGTFVTHAQFRKAPGQRPYPLSLVLNPDVPTVYVRRPAETVADLLSAFEGAHFLNKEVKIPVPDLATAKRVAARYFR